MRHAIFSMPLSGVKSLKFISAGLKFRPKVLFLRCLSLHLMLAWIILQCHRCSYCSVRPHQPEHLILSFDTRPKEFYWGSFIVYKGRYDHVNLCESRLLHQQVCSGKIRCVRTRHPALRFLCLQVLWCLSDILLLGHRCLCLRRVCCWLFYQHHRYS